MPPLSATPLISPTMPSQGGPPRRHDRMCDPISCPVERVIRRYAVNPESRARPDSRVVQEILAIRDNTSRAEWHPELLLAQYSVQFRMRPAAGTRSSPSLQASSGRRTCPSSEYAHAVLAHDTLRRTSERCPS